jgi:arylsulfatase
MSGGVASPESGSRFFVVPLVPICLERPMRRNKPSFAIVAVAAVIGVAALTTAAFAQGAAPSTAGSDVLPAPQPKFGGVIGHKAKESRPSFPAGVTAPQGAPNVLLILTDDVGFGASSTFGGPIPTPSLDRVARRGVLYNNFHTTALCSPTRAALLTGRNHHSVGFGAITEFATGYPGYNSILPKSAATIGSILVGNGYGTSWFGKNHLIPDWLQSPAGPFDQWPSGMGFDYFYGFLGGDTDNWHPALFENTKPVLPPVGDPNYILIHDLADRAIGWIRAQHANAPDKPFFTYFAPGNGHAPHHASKDWIARFKGRFDLGWDRQREVTLAQQKRLGIVPADTVLTPRPTEIPAWDSLGGDEKRLYARMMEVYAAAVAQADHEVGRILDSLEASGQLDNTLVIYIQGDNGASAEGTMQGVVSELGGNIEPESMAYKLSMIDQLGSDRAYNHYPVGWAHAMGTPFQWTKQVASHFGGTRNGMAMSWPKRIKAQGEIRPQFHHVVDIVPTILEEAGIRLPTAVNGVVQKPLEGVSMAYTFDDAKAPARHVTQYFELMANRAIYHDGWMAGTTPQRKPWVVHGATPDPDDYPWELYHVAEDFSQSRDLAKANPKKLEELKAMFMDQAVKHDVLPIDSSFAERAIARRPGASSGRTDFSYDPGMIRIPEGSAPDIKNKSFRITARVDVPKDGAEGVLVTQGGRFGGWGLLVVDGRPMFVYAYSNQDGDRYPGQKKSKTRIVGGERLAPGSHVISFDFAYDGGGFGKGGQGVLSVDDRRVAEGRLEKTLPFRFSLDESFDVGEDTGSPLIDEYEAKMPFRFSGTLRKVDIKLGADPLTQAQHAELRKLEKDAGMAVH